jgi:hypothetical protein
LGNGGVDGEGSTEHRAGETARVVLGAWVVLGVQGSGGDCDVMRCDEGDEAHVRFTWAVVR